MKELSRIQVQQLAYVDALRRAETITQVADDFEVSQSAVSQSLSRLEAMLDVDLLEADGRRRRLTQVGAEVAEYAERVGREIAALGRHLERYRTGDEGALRIGMIDAAALYLFEPVVAEFAHEGKLSLNVDVTGRLLDQLAAFAIELALVVGPAPGFASEVVMDEHLYVYGPRRLKRRELPPASPWVVYPSGSHTRTVVEEGLAELGVRPEVVAESPNPALLHQFAYLGLGWTVLPAGVAEAEPHPLQRRTKAIAARQILAVHRPGTELSPLARQFLEKVRSS